MSYTTLFKFNRRGVLHVVEEFKNSYRGAFAVWSDLAKEYGLSKDGYMSDFKPVWALHKNTDIPLFERITLMTTFDWVAVQKENIDQVADAFEEFHKKYPENHLDLQAKALRLPTTKRDCLGVCWNQTSVNCDMWSDTYKNGHWRPYNLFRGDKHWFMFHQDSS